MKLKNLTKHISNISTIKNLKENTEFHKQIFQNMGKIRTFILKINNLTNKLTLYIEKHNRKEDKELLEILENLIAIQEIFLSKNDNDKLVKIIGDIKK